MVGHTPLHPSYRWLWKSKCQPKHKVFFWLILKHGVNTRGMLRRRHMFLESYTSDNCILKRKETQAYLFFRCNFAKACWNSIGVTSSTSSRPERVVFFIKQQLEVPFFMEIIILMTWSIWRCRNDWIFNNSAPWFPTTKGCLSKSFSLFRIKLETFMSKPF